MFVIKLIDMGVNGGRQEGGISLFPCFFVLPMKIYYLRVS